MSNLTIFKNPGAVTSAALPASSMAATIAESMGGYNRIATNTNGTFKRIVNGEQMGKPIRGEFNAIIVDMLAKPGREYYAGAYDADAKGTRPDCMSNLGDVPEASSPNKQAKNCAACPMNVDGTGQNGKGKACRFKRRVALLLDGDNSGDVYQFNIPAKSLFGKGEGNTHPYESYARYLVANGTSPDRVVTTIAYNLDAETMELNFTAERFITPEELELVNAAQTNPATRKLVSMSAGEADAPNAPAAAAVAAPAAKPATKKPSFLDDDDTEEAAAPAEPVVKKSAKATATPAAVAADADLASIMDEWAED